MAIERRGAEPAKTFYYKKEPKPKTAAQLGQGPRRPATGTTFNPDLHGQKLDFGQWSAALAAKE